MNLEAIGLGLLLTIVSFYFLKKVWKRRRYYNNPILIWLIRLIKCICSIAIAPVLTIGGMLTIGYGAIAGITLIHIFFYFVFKWIEIVNRFIGF